MLVLVLMPLEDRRISVLVFAYCACACALSSENQHLSILNLERQSFIMINVSVYNFPQGSFRCTSGLVTHSAGAVIP